MVSTRRSAGSIEATASIQAEQLPLRRSRRSHAEHAISQATDSPSMSQQQDDAPVAATTSTAEDLHESQTMPQTISVQQPASTRKQAPQQAAQPERTITRKQAQQHQQQLQQPSVIQQPTQPVHAASSMQPSSSYDPWADCGDDYDDDDDNGGEEEEQGQGEPGQGLRSFIDSLSASIASAFQAKSGMQQQQEQDVHGRAATARNHGSQATASGLDNVARREADLPPHAARLRWQPEVEVPKQKASTREVLQTTVQADKPKGLAKQLFVPPTGPRQAAKAKGAAKAETAGKSWFDLPAQKIDDDMKRELRLLRLRGTFDPRRFYKSFDNTKFPKHFAMGTVVEGPQDFYSGRLEAAQRRKATLTDQLLADAAVSQVRKKRYHKLQEEATKYQRVKKRKTDLPRADKSRHRPKH